MNTLVQDLRYGLRMLLRAPSFAIVALLTLALGIGANAAIFTVINSVMLRSLPVQEPEQLATVGDPSLVHSTSNGTPQADLYSYPLYREIRDHNTVFSGVYASGQFHNLNVTIEGGAEKAEGRLVTGNFFDVLGVHALLGRTFTQQEDEAPGASPIAVISYGYWQKRFAGDRGVIGRTVRLNNYPFTIIGVLPVGFSGDSVGDINDVWVPMMMQEQVTPGRPYLKAVRVSWLNVMGRLKPGVSPSQAADNVTSVVHGAFAGPLSSQMNADERDLLAKAKVEVASGRAGFSGLRDQFQAALLLLMGLVGLVLLVACVNVANLLLARSAVRQREIALRMAIGAAPGRLTRQLLTESVLLSLIGGAFGLLMANWAAPALVRLTQSDGVVPLDLAFDWRVLGFTAAVCVLTGLLFGIAPAIRLRGGELFAILKQGGREASAHHHQLLGRVLLAGQVALCVVVLFAAGLLVRSLRKLQEVDLGYQRDHLLMVRVDPVASGYTGPTFLTLAATLMDRVRVLPGVRGVTASENGLFSNTESANAIRMEGFKPKKDNDRIAFYDQVAADYFHVIGIPLRLGRDIGPQDTAGSPPVAVVNESFANFYLPGQNPIGHKFVIEDPENHKPEPIEIVGVSGDAREGGLRRKIDRRFYTPMAHPVDSFIGILNLEIVSVANPAALTDSIRATIRQVEPNLTIASIRPLEENVQRALTTQVLVANLSAFFAGLVLLLVCIGLYGTLSYSVAQRTREIGVRMALGARRADVLAMVLRDAGLVLLIGVAVGLPAGMAASRLFSAMLFGLGHADPLSLIASVLLLGSIGAVAAYIPARRATRVDPMVALRYE